MSLQERFSIHLFSVILCEGFVMFIMEDSALVIIIGDTNT